MPLKLSLKPHEKFIVNGVVIENGDRRTSLVVQNKAAILRDKDILQPDEATTPARRIYFPIQMMYIENEREAFWQTEFAARMLEFMNAISTPDAVEICLAVSRDVMAGEHYRALMKCRKLFDFERERLTYVPDGVPQSASHG